VDSDPVVARPAATVLLVRDHPRPLPGRTPLQVFLQRRVAGMAFAGGMTVFPGGGVDATDVPDPDAWSGPDPAWWGARLGCDAELAGALVQAAVRETFEECGVLVAVDADGAAPDAAALAAPPWEERRVRLAAGELTLPDVLRGEGLAVRGGDLRPWARWVTPPFENRRFDTRFYVAALPAAQEARDLGGEGERAAWLSPGAAVEAHAAGKLPMLPPTLVCLEELAAAPDVATLLATPRAPRPVSPWVARGTTGDLVLRIDLDGRGGGEAGP
jgi:8-oxo-dGTP pyrophosphatase MutT (NUDIX family)